MISAVELKKLRDGEKPILVIDSLAYSRYKQEHIAGAEHFDFPNENIDQWDKSKTGGKSKEDFIALGVPIIATLPSCGGNRQNIQSAGGFTGIQYVLLESNLIDLKKQGIKGGLIVHFQKNILRSHQTDTSRHERMFFLANKPLDKFPLVEEGHTGGALARQYATSIINEDAWHSGVTYDGFTNFGLSILRLLDI